MATATTPIFRCPLCLKTLYQPKLLEQCMHSFCRACICTYVKQFLSTDQCENRVACPICKTLFLGPGSVVLIEEWSQQLPSDILLLTLLGANSSECGPCTVRGQQSQAIKTCKECQERLCLQCLELHRSFKGNRNHTLSDIDSSSDSVHDDELLPMCEYHKQKEVEYYCKDHDELLCSKCTVLRHRTCGILELENSSETLSQKISVPNIRSNFQSFKTDIEAANKNAQKENDRFENQVRKALLDVEDKRRKVNASFDKYKSKIANTTKKHIVQENKNKICDEKISVGIDNSLILLDAAIKSGNYVQLYLRCNAMKRQIDACRKHINDCKSRGKTIKLECSFSAIVKSLINDSSAVGTFQLTAADSTGSFNICNPENHITHDRDQTEFIEEESVSPKVNCEQTAATESLKKGMVGDVGLTTDLKIKSNVRVKTTKAVVIVIPDGSKPIFGGAAYLYDDRVVVTDVNNHRLILLDSDLKFVSKLEVGRRPRKVTVVNKKQVAVGLSNATKVIIVNVGSKGMTIIKCVYTNHLSKCVVSKDQILFMSSYEGKLENEWYLTCYNLQNDEETIFESIHGQKDGTHIALLNRGDRGYILHSCRNDDTVKCHADDGKQIFSYKLPGPAGMDVDSYGNIFVASLVHHKIIHLSPTGKLIKTLAAGKLYKPFEVRMNTAQDKILVTQFESSEIHIIALSYQ